MPTIIDPVRLQKNPNIQMSGGPRFSTTVTNNKGGWRHVNDNWKNAMWKMTLRFIRKDWDFQELIAFFLGRRGPAYPFLIQDPLDHTDNGWGKVLLLDGVYRLVKEYPDLIRPYRRIISRPVQGTIVLTGVNGAPVINYSTGIVTGVTSLAAGASWKGTFDIPMVLVAEWMKYDYSAGGIAEWLQVDLEEVRV